MSDEDVSDTEGENTAKSLAHKYNRTEGMRQQYLGQVSFLCWPVISGRGPAATFFKSVCGEGFPTKSGNR